MDDFMNLRRKGRKWRRWFGVSVGVGSRLVRDTGRLFVVFILRANKGKVNLTARCGGLCEEMDMRQQETTGAS